MADRTRALWAGLAIVIVVVIIALVQGLTIQEVGIPGIASIKFGPKTTSASDPNSGPYAPPTNGGGSGSGATTESTAGPTGSQVITGSWTGSRGDVSVTVTQVENQSGHLRIQATVTNETNDAINLPLFDNASAVDESHHVYKASPFDSNWPDSIASGQTVNGTIEFQERYSSGGGTLDLTFAMMYGFGAPSGSLTVTGIARP